MSEHQISVYIGPRFRVALEAACELTGERQAQFARVAIIERMMRLGLTSADDPHWLILRGLRANSPMADHDLADPECP